MVPFPGRDDRVPVHRSSDHSPPDRPRLKPWFRWTATNDEVVLEHAHVVHVFGGSPPALALLARLLPLLDGTRDAAGLAGTIGAEPAEVRGALRRLAELELLLDGLDEPDAGEGAEATLRLLAVAAGRSGEAAVRMALAAAQVVVAGDGSVAAPLVDLLRRAGVRGASRAGWPDDVASGDTSLVVAAPGPGEQAELARWNERALAAPGCAWLQVLPFDGAIAAVGPLFVAGETCCAACFGLRRAAASGYGSEFDAVGEQPVRAGGGPALDAIVAGVAATVVLRWLAHRSHALPGVFYACEAGGLALSEHRVHRVPRCPVCSAGAVSAAPLPWFKEPGDLAAVAVPA